MKKQSAKPKESTDNLLPTKQPKKNKLGINLYEKLLHRKQPYKNKSSANIFSQP